MKKILLIWAIFSCAALFSVSYSQENIKTTAGINIYVDANATSDGDGSINSPFRTIQEGMNIALFGDTVRVLAGVYNDAMNMKKGVSLIGVDAVKCKIKTTIVASDNCIIKGFTLTKSLTCDSVSPIITENIFTGTSNEWMPSIQLVYASNPIISKNYINDCRFGIQVYDFCNPVIKNNIIMANDVGITMLNEDKGTILNNTIISKTFVAVQILSLDTSVVENNIFFAQIRPADFTFESNIILNNDFWIASGQSVLVPSSNISLDPQFVNIDLQDFHLLSSSPCVDAGNPDPIYNDVDGTRNDIGAYGGPYPIQSYLSSQLTRSIYVSNVSGDPGDTISVFISIDNTAGFAKGDFTLEVDNSLLKYISVKPAGATSNFDIQDAMISGSKTKFSLTSSSGVQSDSKEILEVKYSVNENLVTGDASPLSLKDVALYDVNLREIFVRSITNGAFIVNNTNESENYIYVDSRSTNSGNGSRQNPFNTIMKGIDAAGAGDTIIVFAGNYYGSVFMKEGITLLGSGASVTNIIASGDSTALTFSNIKNAEVSGFTIRGDQDHFPGTPIISCESSSPVIKKNRLEITFLPGEFGITLWDSSNAILEKNYIKGVNIDVMGSNPIIRDNVMEIPGAATAAISCRDGSAPEINNNILDKISGGEAIYINDANPTIKNNMIYCDDGGVGLFISDANNSKIYNNIFTDKSATGSGIQVYNSSENEIINNTIITHGKGIEEQNSNSSIFNNIIINNNNFGVQLSPSSNSNYNDVWNNFSNYSGMDPGANDISLDPLFVDKAKGNYKLALNSPCKNAGNPEALYNNLDGTRNDIGAYGGPYVDSSWLSLDGSSLAIDSITALTVDTIKINVRGKSMKGIAEIDMNLSFDPSLLSVISANSGSLTKTFSLEKTNLKTGSISFSLKSNKGIIEEEGDLIELRLGIIAGQPSNTFLHFDSAAVMDEAIFKRSILNLKDGKITIVTGVEVTGKTMPEKYFLFQNYPNPFNPITTIKYGLPKESNVQLIIYNILGEKVTELVDTFQKAGSYNIEWNADKFASGVYIYRIKAGDFISSRKLMLLK